MIDRINLACEHGRAEPDEGDVLGAHWLRSIAKRGGEAALNHARQLLALLPNKASVDRLVRERP